MHVSLVEFIIHTCTLYLSRAMRATRICWCVCVYVGLRVMCDVNCSLRKEHRSIEPKERCILEGERVCEGGEEGGGAF